MLLFWTVVNIWFWGMASWCNFCSPGFQSSFDSAFWSQVTPRSVERERAEHSFLTLTLPSKPKLTLVRRSHQWYRVSAATISCNPAASSNSALLPAPCGDFYLALLFVFYSFIPSLVPLEQFSSNSPSFSPLLFNSGRKKHPKQVLPALTRRVWSQEPEQKAVPSGETRRVLTRFSCPNRMDTRDPFSTSQTLMV